jgi:hypothetical protein
LKKDWKYGFKDSNSEWRRASGTDQAAGTRCRAESLWKRGRSLAEVHRLPERCSRGDAKGCHPFPQGSAGNHSVVLVAVFLFGFFFMVTDFVFNRIISQILHKLGGAQ